VLKEQNRHEKLTYNITQSMHGYCVFNDMYIQATIECDINILTTLMYAAALIPRTTSCSQFVKFDFVIEFE